MDFPGDDHVTQGFMINLWVFHSEPIPLTISIWVQCMWVGVGVWELIPRGYPCPSLLATHLFGKTVALMVEGLAVLEHQDPLHQLSLGTEDQ